MYCRNCGGQLEINHRFCAACGAKALDLPDRSVVQSNRKNKVALPTYWGAIFLAVGALVALMGLGLIRWRAETPILIKGSRLPTTDELAIIESLQLIVNRTISMIPVSAQNPDMDDYSRLYNYTESAGDPISMRDLVEGELYKNLTRIFDGLEKFYGRDGTPEVLYHFFGQGRGGMVARQFYSRYLKDRRAFLSAPVYSPSLDLQRSEIQELIRNRLAQGVDYSVANGFSGISSHRMMQGTIIQNQWELTKDTIWTLPFADLKKQIFMHTPTKGNWNSDTMMFPGLKDYEIAFYLALGSDLPILSLKREYETWLATNQKPRAPPQ